jgi:hypothetical protein
MKTLLGVIKDLGFLIRRKEKEDSECGKRIERLSLFGFIVKKLKHSSTKIKIRGRRGLDTR